MDLIHFNQDMIEQHFLAHFFCDFEISENDNCTFEIKRSVDYYDEIAPGDYVAINNTEFGGKVLYIRHNTAEGKIYITGNTWRGILRNKFLCPESGKDYLITPQAPLPAVVSWLINLCGLNTIFKPGAIPAAFTQFQFKRYCSLYTGLKDLFNSVGLTLQLRFENNAVYIDAVINAQNRYELSNYEADVDVTDNSAGVNHLICLGQGELKNRTVCHLYKQFDGSIGTVQRFTGAEEIVEKYENTNAATAEELKESGIEHFLEILNAETKRDLLYKDGNYKIGDTLIKVDDRTKIECSATISKIVFTIDKGQPYENEKTTIDYS